MRYLVPRSDVAVTVIWAAVALGWRRSFTVCQPGLGIVTRVSVGGLKGGKEGRKDGWKGGGKAAQRERVMEEEVGQRGRKCSAACCCVRADDVILTVNPRKQEEHLEGR